MMKLQLSSLWLALAIVLAACGGSAVSPSLAGTSWKLDQIAGQPVEEQTSPTLAFDNKGQVSGNASCNSFGGTYDAEHGKLTFGPLWSTMMACPDSGVMEQEAAYFKALAEAASYTVEGEQLTLMDANGKVLAEFVK